MVGGERGEGCHPFDLLCWLTVIWSGAPTDSLGGGGAAGAAKAGVAMADAAAAALGNPVRRLGGSPLVLGGWGLQLPGI
jgi:hypothetical protein